MTLTITYVGLHRTERVYNVEKIAELTPGNITIYNMFGGEPQTHINVVSIVVTPDRDYSEGE